MNLFGNNGDSFDFSVILAVDQVGSKDAEKKVRDFVKNLEKQNLGINRIEMIFAFTKPKSVAKLVKDLKKKYPRNVRIEKCDTADINALTEVATRASGKYIAMPEITASYSKKAFSSVKKFFSENRVDVVKVPVFEKGGRCIDRAYLTKPKVVSLELTPKYATLDIHSCFFKKSEFKNCGVNSALRKQYISGELGINSKAKYFRTGKSYETAKYFDLAEIASKFKNSGEIGLYAMAKFAHENEIKEVKPAGDENTPLYIEELNEKINQLEKDREYDYKISVIIPVYKVEDYVEETFASIRKQNIGFFENVQVIFVDDGSPDRSGEICDKIAKKYPENVICVHKENGGVSSARNLGLEYATGKYINFCDPDDYYKSKMTFLKVNEFMEEHGDEVDFVTIPIFFFEAKKGAHPLNNKFAFGTRVIDLTYEPQYVQLHLAPSFFKSDVIKKYRFNTDLKISEDAEIVIRVLSEKMKLGVCSEVQYMYRKREDNSSALQNSVSNLTYYTDSMNKYMLRLIEDLKDESGNIPLFLQYTFAYELQWRVTYSEDLSATVLNEEQVGEYVSNVKKVLSYIGDEVIAKSPYANFERRYKMLEIKGTLNPKVELLWRHPTGYEYALTSNGLVIGYFTKNATRIHFVEIKDGVLTIGGESNILYGQFENVSVSVTVGDKEYPTTPIPELDVLTTMWGKPIFKYHKFVAKINLSEIELPSDITVVMNCDDIKIYKTNLVYFGMCKINARFRNQYYAKDGYLVRASANKMVIDVANPDFISALENQLQYEMLISRNARKEELVACRKEYFERIKEKKKPVWLITDRILKADDNGKAFFKYVMENHADEVDAYFILSRESVDYDTLCEIGPVLDYGSHEHFVMMLLADKFISSSADENVLNPFAKDRPYLRGLIHYDFIFLQHGVTQNDISGWLGRFKKDIKGFVTAAKAEHDSIVNGKGYNYDSDRVWLTGFSRFDLLYHDEKNFVTIMPTWRKYLLSEYDYETGMREAKAELAESEYVKFYSALMSSQKLLNSADKCGYKIKFMPHPGMVPVADVFARDDRVEFLDFNTSYRDIYAWSNLIVTDYSSAVFDFSYMRKPIVYCQFDADTFFGGGHVVERGYFDYERDGFGEVEYDVESTVDRIIEYMENDCKLKDKYRQRIDNFFAFNDKNSRERIYKKIIEMK